LRREGSRSRTLRKPPALRKGDLVGVCAPSGPVEADRLYKGLAELEALGLRVRVPEGILSQKRLSAGSIERRVAELHALFADDEVAGIVCARGGEGAGWLLKHLDEDLIGAHHKVFVGYSDITFLHLLFDRMRLVSFHGPMVAVDFTEALHHPDSFWRAVSGEGTPYASEPDDLLPLRSGVGEGRLRGGCLSMVAAAAGTPWSLTEDEEGTLLFLEDVDERPYEIDRMLLQLRDSGTLNSVKGVVFGDMKGCYPRREVDYTLDDVILEALQGFDIPVALGLSSGHTAGPNVTLPLGVRARLSCGETAGLEILEAAVV
jgi:muramoyltetrapeptide carboxypeptidase